AAADAGPTADSDSTAAAAAESTAGAGAESAADSDSTAAAGAESAPPLTRTFGSVSGFFFNPNIHPIDEFERRKTSAAELFRGSGLPLIVLDDFAQDEWEAFEAASRGDTRARCEMCYRARLSRTAQAARAGGFDAFSTTLLISPYQDHELIRSVCEEEAARSGVRFYYEDFRPHFREGQAIAKELGLYRQKYCGCIISKTN
ncbi:MAG: epoxyqueuosine reductase QueH, partial [Clostridiales bacterium]|nr:epoxyqueuosine reductase QueH [Clostridiales bacterium]